jgi:hypothetical protein
MSICKITGMACNCQPDDGYPCDGEKTLKEGFHGWRVAAINAESKLSKALELMNRWMDANFDAEERDITDEIVAFLKDCES